MPVFERAGVSLYYEEFGSGFPLLLFAPGGMRSAIDFWHKSPIDPTTLLRGIWLRFSAAAVRAGRDALRHRLLA